MTPADQAEGKPFRRANTNKKLPQANRIRVAYMYIWSVAKFFTWQIQHSNCDVGHK